MEIISVSDISYLFIEPESQKIKIYDLDTQKYLYSGYAGDNVPYELDRLEVKFIDNITDSSGIICFNVRSSHDA